MANLNGYYNPFSDTAALPPEYYPSPLDMYFDDAEFRSGYPFTNIEEIESNREILSSHK